MLILCYDQTENHLVHRFFMASLAETAGSLLKGGANMAVDTAGSVVKFAAQGAAGLWKIAFGQETGAIVDPAAGAVGSAVDGAGSALKAGIGTGYELLSNLSPPFTPSVADQGQDKGRMV